MTFDNSALTVTLCLMNWQSAFLRLVKNAHWIQNDVTLGESGIPLTAEKICKIFLSFSYIELKIPR